MEAKNKKAYFDYFILKELEAGISLKGTEIKSIKDGKVQLKDSFVRIKNDEAYVINLFISKYEQGNQFNHEETRTRKLLLHKKQIKDLKKEVEQGGLSIVPLKMYLKNQKAKLLIGLVKGKKLYDKREAIKKRDLNREVK